MLLQTSVSLSSWANSAYANLNKSYCPIFVVAADKAVESAVHVKSITQSAN